MNAARGRGRGAAPPTVQALALALALTVAASHLAWADDPCDAFAWDVRTARALFAREAQPAQAGRAIADAPALAAATPYALALLAQDTVHFIVMPGRKAIPTGAHGGLATIHVAHAGRYRISLDSPAWVDAVVAGQTVPSAAFEGRPGCDAPHKVVEFELPQGELVIQLSAALAARMRLTITATSPPAR